VKALCSEAEYLDPAVIDPPREVSNARVWFASAPARVRIGGVVCAGLEGEGDR
jgi:hypothetical protein